MTRLKVLIACEFSGVVSGAFRARGHSAWSCDRLPSESDKRHHIHGEALDAIRRGRPTDGARWDVIGIHYSCTWFTNAGVRWVYVGGHRRGGIDHQRLAQMELAAAELAGLWLAAQAVGARIYFENPIMHRYAVAALAKRIPGWSERPTQILQPWECGAWETKATGLWLHQLPPPNSALRHRGGMPAGPGAARIYRREAQQADAARSLRIAGRRPLEGAEPNIAGDRRTDGLTVVAMKTLTLCLLLAAIPMHAASSTPPPVPGIYQIDTREGFGLRAQIIIRFFRALAWP